MAGHPIRGSHAWRLVRAAVLRDATVCSLCGRPLDFEAPARSAMSPSVDHVIPLKAMRGYDEATRREMAFSIDNLRAVHYGCNARRGAGRPVKVPKLPRRTSRQW